MVLKVTRTVGFTNKFTFRAGELAIATINVDLLTADAGAEHDLQTYTMLRDGFFRNSYLCLQDGMPLCQASKAGWFPSFFEIEFQGRHYQLRRVSLLNIGVFDGKMCVGQIRREYENDYPETVTGFEGLPASLWLFCFWISLKYWTPRDASG